MALQFGPNSTRKIARSNIVQNRAARGRQKGTAASDMAVFCIVYSMRTCTAQQLDPLRIPVVPRPSVPVQSIAANRHTLRGPLLTFLARQIPGF